jgi:hypothetical protein
MSMSHPVVLICYVDHKYYGRRKYGTTQPF